MFEIPPGKDACRISGEWIDMNGLEYFFPNKTSDPTTQNCDIGDSYDGLSPIEPTNHFPSDNADLSTREGLVKTYTRWDNYLAFVTPKGEVMIGGYTEKAKQDLIKAGYKVVTFNLPIFLGARFADPLIAKKFDTILSEAEKCRKKENDRNVQLGLGGSAKHSVNGKYVKPMLDTAGLTEGYRTSIDDKGGRSIEPK